MPVIAAIELDLEDDESKAAEELRADSDEWTALASDEAQQLAIIAAVGHPANS
eukprot:CAMPEP_0170456100 /NCGR_PEP_ID=MMETSP0123-20130129/3848_1 /TAXON_ID=182087 /ORGANISM="Favella ehrenbergii, Strain Fehren 1" /LENGTH=52 /DNA_ID=CAMNT_0010719467 /DNA_START=1884 /DNA_END=2042 /DNA_ORIENTATION=+